MRKLREVLRLRFELKLGYQQIGRSCAIAVSTVHKYLKRAEAFRASRKPFRDRAKTLRLPAGITVRLQPGILFVFTPERFSRSPRNRVRLPAESAQCA